MVQQTQFVVTDVGSTTTKALLFEKVENSWRFVAKGEAATTVEAPYANVMIGVINAFTKLRDRSNINFFTVEGQELKTNIPYLSTSSAGGGLQMVVCGHVGKISAESAQRAALGGGAILLDVFAADDGRSLYQRLERLRTLRPDMILLSGGVDLAEPGSFLIEMCDFIRSAQPKPKFGYHYALPIIYAGTSKAVDLVHDLLGDRYAIKVVDNLRPSFQDENLSPTREAIHELFIEHVMSHAPGYAKLKEVTTTDIMPTPTAVGEILTRYAIREKKNILCVDIGGATTDVFSVVQGNYMRSVSANFGMSYSIGHVASTAGAENIARWLPQGLLTEEDMMILIGTKLIYPTDLPATKEELLTEQAVAREALRLSFEDHQQIAKIQKPTLLRFGQTLAQASEAVRSLTIEDFDLIIGSGGVLSNAPNRKDAAVMLIDAFQPTGVVELMVDSVFMLPHLGVFSKIDEQGAIDLLETECLIPLGTVLAPKGFGKKGQPGLTLRGTTSAGHRFEQTFYWGRLNFMDLSETEQATLEVIAHGETKWPLRFQKLHVRGGKCGVIVDLRGRPMEVKVCRNTELFDEK